MELRCITLRTTPKPVCSYGLLALPAELRIRIYTYILVEVPKWKRRHKAACGLASRAMCLERPPFIGEDGNFSTKEDRCGCTLRKGVSLLLVNRQIHNEAVEIFWAQNTFLFAPASQFVEDVGRTLRPTYRHMLQHVCILDDMLGADNSYYSDYTEVDGASVFRTLSKCAGLRTIEVGHRVLPCSADVFGQLHRLPRLLSFSLAVVLSYEVKVIGGTTFELTPHMSGHRRLPKKSVLWLKTGKEINPMAISSDEALRECERDFATNFLVHLRNEIKSNPKNWMTKSGTARKQDNHAHAVRQRRRQHAEMDPMSPWTTFISSPTTPAEMTTIFRFFLQDEPSTQVLTLRDRSECAIDLLGFPSSGATRARHARERMMEAKALHATGKLTIGEERVRQQIETRREGKKLAELAAIEAAKRECQVQRAEKREEQKRAAKEALRIAQQARAEAQVEVQDLRLAERKRLQPAVPMTEVQTEEEDDEDERPSASRPKAREIRPRPLKKQQSKHTRKVYTRACAL